MNVNNRNARFLDGKLTMFSNPCPQINVGKDGSIHRCKDQTLTRGTLYSTVLKTSEILPLWKNLLDIFNIELVERGWKISVPLVKNDHFVVIH